MNRLTSISRMGTYVNGRPFTPDEKTPTGLPIVRIRQMLDPSCESDYFDGHVEPRNLVADGDLLFSWSATLAVTLWDRGPAALNQHLFNVHPAHGVDKRWLRWALVDSIPRFTGLMHGSAMTHITKEMLKQVALPVPPLDEQRRIADFLDAETVHLDTLTALRVRQLALLSEHWQSTVANAISGVSALPVALRRLGVGVTTGPFGTVFSADSYVRDGIPMINPSHISRGVIEPSPEHSVSPTTARRLLKHALQTDDLIVSRKGDIGRAARVSAQQDGWICGSDCIALRTSGSGLVPTYLDFLLRLTSTREQLLARSYATTMPSLNEGNLLDLVVPVPDTLTQVELAISFEESDAQTKALGSLMRIQIDTMAEHRQALITAAVNGQLDVTTPRGLDS